jgi:NADP-dependent 3-hydroxy acid dehydrogenase YdfG
MPKKFAGKIAVVTGGSTGMGLATARRFVHEGMDHVFITGRDKDALDAAAAEIGKNVTAVLAACARHWSSCYENS